MFFQQLAKWGERPALIEGDTIITYAELAEQVADFSAQLSAGQPAGRKLLLLQAHNDRQSLVAYLAALQGQHTLLLVDGTLAASQLAPILQAYQPNLHVQQGQISQLNAEPVALDAKLALLLSTSGSTGSPKQVALSAANLQANAESICAYLPIESSDTTITTLPFAYSYGLSVINSHLLVGACIVLNQAPVTSREFWQRFEGENISSIAGVPHSWQMLLRLGFTRKNHLHLRYFTQAGGKLDTNTAKALADYADTHNKAFYMMYGQTEATARMAYLPPEKAQRKPASIGQAIPGGKLAIKSDDGQWITEAEQQGELYYQGKNVMLGYTGQQADLAQFSPSDWLATGDLAYCDGEGDFVISGRLKRIVKPFGQRINLDEVESWLQQQGLKVACLGTDQQLQVAVEQRDSSESHNIQQLTAQISEFSSLHPSAIKVLAIDALPITANHKRDYQALSKVFVK